MLKKDWQSRDLFRTDDPRRGQQIYNQLSHLVVMFGVLVLSWLLLGRMGFSFYLGILVALVLMSIYAIISFKYLHFPFLVWLLSVGGFSDVWSIQTPGLPDFYIYRLAFIWLILVFGLKYIIEGRKFRLPVLLDWVIVVHCAYLCVRMMQGSGEYFSIWLAVSMIPTIGYFLAKNIVFGKKLIRQVFLGLLFLSIYYNITSVAEKFDLDFLIWPKYMLEEHAEFVGRSNGPFRQGPLFGTIIGMLLPIHLYFIHTVRRNIVKFLLFVSLGLGFAGLYFTYTRGAWLAGIVALAATVYLNRKDYWRSMAPLLIIVPFLAIAFLGLSQDKFMKDRLEEDRTIDSRVGVIVTAARMWRDNPVFGIGFSQFKEKREEYVQAVELPGFGSIKFMLFRNTSLHDIYLGPLAESGLVGSSLQFSVYLLILRMFLVKIGLARQRSHTQRFILPVLGGLFLGFLVGGLVIDYRYFLFIWVLFFASAGILAGFDPSDEGNEYVA